MKLCDLFNNPRCKCQKKITLTPKQFPLEGTGFKKTMEKIVQKSDKMWNNFNEPGLKIASPIVSAGVAAKSRNPPENEGTSKNLKS